MAASNSFRKDRPIAPSAGFLAFTPWLGFLWGFAEATVFFIVPDVLISFVALYSLRHVLTCAAAALAGSVAGGALVYAAAVTHPEWVKPAIESVPFIPPRMFALVRSDLLQHGAWALLQGPLTGTPYKLYALEAPAHLTLMPFLLVSIPARLARFIAVGGFAALIAFLARRLRSNLDRALVLAHAFSWCVFYALYWRRML